MLEPLRKELKNLLSSSKQKEVFRRLREEILLAEKGADLYNDMVAISARWEQSRQSDNLGLIKFEDKNITFNSVNKALIWLIDRIEIGDLNPGLRRKCEELLAIPPVQRLTCDRVEQSDQIQIDYYDPPAEIVNEKIKFYYLHGDSRQEHQSFFERVTLDLSAQLDNWQEGDYDSGVRIEAFDCKPKTSRNPKILRINIMRELLGYFFKPLNKQQPILKKKLVDLLASPKLKDFGANDFVFILITADEHNWDKNVIPSFIKTLYNEFLKSELPSNSPFFYFFFGLEYRKNKESIRQEVKEALEQAKYGIVLPELAPLAIDDVSEWLSRYPMLLPPQKEAHEYAQELFLNTSTLDMLDVELKLKQLIEYYNKGFTIFNKTQ